MFDIEDAVNDPCSGLIIIVQEADRKFALLVDDLEDQVQVVIKSLSEGIQRTEGVSGGAILANGRVGLILDPGGLYRSFSTNGSFSEEKVLRKEGERV